jgi:hypothetical protein
LRGRLVFLSLLSALVAPVSAALAAPGGIGIRPLDAPPGSRDPLARSYIVDRLTPGARLSRRVEISNTTHTTVVVAVYAAAANVDHGLFRFASGRSSNELSSWTSVSRPVLHLAPGAKAVERVNVDVAGEAPAGERYAVVWAAVSAAAPAVGGVTLVNRVGVRMYISVGAGGALPSSFAIGSLVAARSRAGKPSVAARVRNTGPSTLTVGGTLVLADGPGGLRAGPFPVATVAALAPGGSQLVTVQLDAQLPRGPWRAHLSLTSGRIHHEAVATIVFPTAKLHAQQSHRSPLVAALALSALVAGAAAAVLLIHLKPGLLRGRS